MKTIYSLGIVLLVIVGILASYEIVEFEPADHRAGDAVDPQRELTCPGAGAGDKNVPGVFFCVLASRSVTGLDGDDT